MPRYFTYYWMNKFCDYEEGQEPEEELLTHLGGNRFLKKGVRPGDWVYLVTVKKGELYLLSRMEVAEIVDREEAARLLDCSPDELWQAAEHLIANSETALPIRYNRWVPFDVTQRLRFVSGGKTPPRPLWFEAPGVLDRQTLRSVREMTRDSALELDILLDKEQN